MNKYEKLFNDIVDKTESNKMHWKQASKSSHADLIFNPDTTFRQYTAEYQKGDATYEVVFVEKKYDDPVHDFACQEYKPEILIVEGEELLVTLTDSMIDKSGMIELVQNIEAKSDKVKKLFE